MTVILHEEALRACTDLARGAIHPQSFENG